jgi:hypothetical protein
MEYISHQYEASHSKSALEASEQIKLSHVHTTDVHESLLDTMNAALHHDSMASLLKMVVGSIIPMI